MYVCLCMGVTDRDVADAISDGASSVQEVMGRTGAGTRCGSCAPSIASLVVNVAPPSTRRALPVVDDRVPTSNAA
jgi:bacterioferritin-associated ferredoxin